MLKSFKDVVNRGSEVHVPNEDVLQEVNQVDVVGKFVEAFLIDQLSCVLGEPDVELKILFGLEKHFTCQQLVKETAEGPHV